MNAERNVDTELPDVGFDVDILRKKNPPKSDDVGLDSREQPELALQRLMPVI